MSNGTVYKYKYFNSFAGGLDVASSPLELADNQMQIALNGYLTRKGAFRKRSGYKKDIAAAIGTDVVGVVNVFRYYTGSSSYTMIAAQTASKIRIFYQDGAAYTELTGGADFVWGTDIQFVAYQDYLFICDGTNFQYWDGSAANKADCVFSTDTGYIASLTPRLLTVVDDRLFVVDSSNDDVIYFSDFGAWNTDPGTDLLFKDVNTLPIPERNSDLKGIRSWTMYGNNDELMIKRENGLWTMLGKDEDDYVLVKMSDEAGGVSAYGYRASDYGTIVFVGNDMIYEISDTAFPPIGTPIKPLIAGKDLTRSWCVYDKAHELILISCGDVTLCWNLVTRSWTEMDINFTCACRYTASEDHNKVVFGFNDSPYLWHYSGVADAADADGTGGNDIKRRLKTKLVDLYEFGVTKFLRGVKTMSDSETATPFEMTVFVNDHIKPPRTDTHTVTVTYYGKLWGVDDASEDDHDMIWDDDEWAGDEVSLSSTVLGDNLTANHFDVLIESEDKLESTIYGIGVEYTELATRR